ncbi:MAG: DUF3800 domain-containing protein [Chloroflexi bacterium]|nr:DUF3800 domain-containing protein [Chloroflexota bacterium]
MKPLLPDDPDERRRFLEQQARAREAVRRLQRHDAAVHLLAPAIRAVELAGVDATPLRSVLQTLQTELEKATHQGRGRIASRRRPTAQKQWRQDGPRHRYRLFIDESGGSRLSLTPDEPFFAVGGLLVHESAYADLERHWNAWKVQWVGREHATMHARHLRRKNIRFYVRHGDPEEALAALHALIREVDVTLMVMAIRKSEFQARYLDRPVDPFLPDHHYGLCLTFLLERVVYFLLNKDDAHAHVIAESRNRMEDAKLQLEYQRLQLEGTLFQAATWFRYQLGPHITFQVKEDNVAGLQLADVLLKAVVDKLIAPHMEPLRWDVARMKLYDGGKDRIRGWGLKLFPHDDKFVESVLGQETKTENAL